MPFPIDKNVLLKYDVPGPRYTSYPTAPAWSQEVTSEIYLQKLRDFGRSCKTLSLYIHIPFCQSLCAYCGCNVLVRKKEDKFADEYLTYLFQEIYLTARYLGERKKVLQLHLGGGTPTFLSEDHLERILGKIREHFDLDVHAEIAIEADVRTTDQNKIQKIRGLGFNRVSLGVQDFDEKVLQAVHRPQTAAQIEAFYAQCRRLAFDSINFDLIYGLPHQSVESFRRTVDHVIALKPDRIALYSFAYIPWLKKHQSKIDPTALPSSETKMDIFLHAREMFLQGGYQAIAMDHFALAGDELAKAFRQNTLYRNFMGYTVKPADEYIGFGLTAIGFLENTFVQNHKTLAEYFGALSAGHLPVERGKVLTRDDQIRQWVIHALMCHFRIEKAEFSKKFSVSFDEYFKTEHDHLNHCAEDGLIRLEPEGITATGLGKIFIRNVCMGFDAYLKGKAGNQRFSRTV
ncbi:MAG: oxygen-independent coproporphyrinogen III oxidase [Omnitrophica WOR_2 bacterium GWA2_45_18]|nr:MAG: oxygen-independent coproporphyrinogen III oxidase [Omnitrophica WOR_2 bacterium GWA2_45_18]